MTFSDTATIEPGKPWQNGSVESFNGTFRSECLNREWFSNLREASILIEQWRGEYNTQRPHSSLSYRTPAEVGEACRNGGSQISGVAEIAALGACYEVGFKRSEV